MTVEPSSPAVRSDQLRILFTQAPIALAVNVVVAAMMAAVLVPVEPDRFLVLWLGLMVVIVALRYALCLWYRRAATPGSRPHAWAAYSVLGSGLTGALWGIGGALLFPEADIYRMFVALTIGGMCAGAVVVHASHLPTLLAFIVTAIPPIAARFAFEGSIPEEVLAGMMIVFVVALAVAGYNLNRSVVETLELRIELARNARALEATNLQLRDESQQRRAAQDMLRRVEKLDALGRLTGGLAHDFNNLLQVIIGNLDLLKFQVTSDLGGRLLAAAHDGAERASKLTHSLLAFARDQQLAMETEDLNAVIEDFSQLLHDAVGENAALDFAMASQPLFCQLDRTHFQTALLNLVLNAYHALPPQGGQIKIETGRAAIEEREAAQHSDLKAGPYVMVAVIDTGVGMSPEVLERAFDPFYTTKEIGKGSGLGLSQVYGFVSQSGGSIAIASRPSEGTTVRVLLPCAAAPSTVAMIPQRSAAFEETVLVAEPESRSMTILVVEDEPAVRALIAEGVSERGYHVLTASDGPSALRLLQGDEPIHLLFSDVMMPNGLRGDELAKEALKLRPNLKVLLTSGYSPTRSDRDLEFPFLQKPFSYRELALKLEDVLGAAVSQ